MLISLLSNGRWADSGTGQSFETPPCRCCSRRAMAAPLMCSSSAAIAAGAAGGLAEWSRAVDGGGRAGSRASCHRCRHTTLHSAHHCPQEPADIYHAGDDALEAPTKVGACLRCRTCRAGACAFASRRGGGRRREGVQPACRAVAHAPAVISRRCLEPCVL